MKKRKVKLNYIPYKKDGNGKVIKNYSFTKQISGIEILDISNTSKLIIQFLTTNKYIPIPSRRVQRYFFNKMIYDSLGISNKTYDNAIKELTEKKYLTLTDDEYIINVHTIEQAVNSIYQNKIIPILKDNKMIELIESLEAQLKDKQELIEFRKFKNESYEDLEKDITEIKTKLSKLDPNKDNPTPTPKEEKKQPETPSNKQLEHSFNNNTDDDELTELPDNDNNHTAEIVDSFKDNSNDDDLSDMFPFNVNEFKSNKDEIITDKEPDKQTEQSNNMDNGQDLMFFVKKTFDNYKQLPESSKEEKKKIEKQTEITEEEKRKQIQSIELDIFNVPDYITQAMNAG